MTNKPSKTTKDAAIYITRANESWSNQLGTPVTLTYAYRESADGYISGKSNEGSTFSRFTKEQIAATEKVIHLLEEVCGLKLVRMNSSGYTNNASCLFANYTNSVDNSAAITYTPRHKDASVEAKDGDLWYNLYGQNGKPDVAAGSANFHTLIHEMGHVAGLGHPGDYNAGKGKPLPTYEDNAVYAEDTNQYSVMSYFEAAKSGADHQFGGKTIYASTFLLHDIAALQRFYGANMDTRSGNDRYGFGGSGNYAISSENQKVVYCIWDGGGKRDVLDFSGYSSNQRINLAGNSFSSVGGLVNNVSIAAGTLIESAVGGKGKDIIAGNMASNSLFGGAGADKILGLNGDDILVGGNGDDWMDGGAGNDRFVFKSSDIGDKDTIAHFAHGDKLDFGALDASKSVSGTQPLIFIGTKAFTGNAGQIRASVSGGSTEVTVDLNGDKKSDLTIKLEDFTGLKAGDLIGVKSRSTYEVVNLSKSVTWAEAKAEAEKLGGHLATITSASENLRVFNLVNDPKYWTEGGAGVWLGGYQDAAAQSPESGWHWVTKEKWNFTAWSAGNPDDLGATGNQDSLQMWAAIGPYWDDVDGKYRPTGTHAFVVEYDLYA